jgi:predicted permease
VPGIESAALATSVPFSFSWGTQVSIPGRDSVPTVKDGGPYFIGVTSAYLKTMGMRLLRGRGIEESDLANTHRVVVVNESIARLWWPGGDAIGRCMKIGGDTMPCTEVVGIVTNPRRQSLIEDVSLQFFLPIEQTPAWVDSRVIVIRPSGSADAAAEPLRRQLQVAEPGLPYLRLQPLAELVNPETRSWRLGSTMFAAFGALALVLAAVGLYSMLAYDVGQRSHELGVRVALGARAPDVTRTVMDGGVRLVAVGITTGIVLTLAGGRFVQPLLFQTSAREPLVLASAAVALAAVALLAMLVPTWRATRVDPIVALRAD